MEFTYMSAEEQAAAEAAAEAAWQAGMKEYSDLQVRGGRLAAGAAPAW